MLNSGKTYQIYIYFFVLFLFFGGVGGGGEGGVMLINRKLDRIFEEIMFSFLSKNALPMNRVALISLLFMGDGFNFLVKIFMK